MFYFLLYYVISSRPLWTTGPWPRKSGKPIVSPSAPLTSPIPSFPASLHLKPMKFHATFKRRNYVTEKWIGFCENSTGVKGKHLSLTYILKKYKTISRFLIKIRSHLDLVKAKRLFRVNTIGCYIFGLNNYMKYLKYWAFPPVCHSPQMRQRSKVCEYD